MASAAITFKSNPNVEIPITIPSDNLKTDQNFDFTVPVDEDGNEVDKSAVDITIDFDLSKSLVLEGSEYKLKPVLHIVETADAATIEGFIANSAFPAAGYVIISVLDSTGQEYTKVRVDKDTGASETSYAIFWLVPDQAYTVQINYNPGQDDDPATDEVQDNYDESILFPPASDPDYPDGTLQPGDVYQLDFPLPK